MRETTDLKPGRAAIVTSSLSGISIDATEAAGGVRPYVYRWQRRVDKGSYEDVSDRDNVFGASTLRLFDGSITIGRLYSYRLRYSDESGKSVTSNEVSDRVGLILPFGGGENLEARIDRERRERERELLLLLLLLLLRTRQYGDAALRVGSDPFAAMSAVLLGSRALNQPGGTERMAALLLLADRTGFRRTQLIVPGGVYRPIDYRGSASIALSQLWGTLQRRVGLAFAKAEAGVQGLRKSLRDTFVRWGYTEGGKGPWSLKNAAVSLVGKVYNRGYWRGWQREEAQEQLEGFFYSSVLDARTSDICRKYQRVKLPQNHPWWLTHWPPNHAYCRSTVLPILGRYEETDDPPFNPPPDPGYGRIEAADLYSFARTTTDRVDAMGRLVQT